ncbi:hypothetical protein [Leucobacter sp. USHLN153]|uniref:hypothetical protein n=1 Tax=Leucobacter sp. USHLN153 TaxID=3081268 RepID=UPI0030188BAA
MKKLNASIAIATVLLLTGCGGADVANEKSDAEASFSGPYAAEFKESYEQLEDAKVKEYLRDGKISEAEFQAVSADLVACLEPQGITFKGYDEYGNSSLEGDPARVANEDLQERISECTTSTGESVVAHLYFMAKRDPGREVTEQTQVDCLIRAGVVPPEFTLEELNAGALNEMYPPEFLYEPPGEEVRTKMETCQNDPLHAYQDQ